MSILDYSINKYIDLLCHKFKLNNASVLQIYDSLKKNKIYNSEYNDNKYTVDLYLDRYNNIFYLLNENLAIKIIK